MRRTGALPANSRSRDPTHLGKMPFALPPVRGNEGLAQAETAVPLSALGCC